MLAATALIQQGFGPCGLLGHSLGGAASLLAVARVKTVRSVAVIGAPATPEHSAWAVRRPRAGYPPRRAGRGQHRRATLPISAAFLDDLARHDQAAAVASLGRPLLVLHAVMDTVVEVKQGERNFAAARQPKAFHPLLVPTIC